MLLYIKKTCISSIMKIGLISDTHDNIDNILKAVREFNNREVDIVLHSGDFVSPIAVESFAGIKLVGILQELIGLHFKKFPSKGVRMACGKIGE